jgi:hypothetical protein
LFVIETVILIPESNASKAILAVGAVMRKIKIGTIIASIAVKTFVDITAVKTLIAIFNIL